MIAQYLVRSMVDNAWKQLEDNRIVKEIMEIMKDAEEIEPSEFDDITPVITPVMSKAQADKRLKGRPAKKSQVERKYDD